ncbi:MAG: AbrB/MazE/SpoVT family DNA-binding domain-containing protein [bacterium]
MAFVKMLAKGQVVIPRNTRKRLKIGPGSRLQIMEYQGVIYLIPPVDNPVEAARGILPQTPSLSDALLEERNRDFT